MPKTKTKTKTKTKPEPARGGTLTPLQQAFVQAYAVGDKNATQAAIAAGYSPRTARVQVYDLLRNPGVKAELDRVRERVTKKTVYDAATAFRRLMRLGEMAIQDRDLKAAARIEELCMRMHGLLTDKPLVEMISVDLTAALRDAKARANRVLSPAVRPARDSADVIDAECRALPSTCTAGQTDNQSDVPVLDLAAARLRADRGASSEPAAAVPAAALASRMFE